MSRPPTATRLRRRANNESTEHESTTTTERPTTTVPTFRGSTVVDGDALQLSDGSTVRLIGLDTPETGSGVCASNASARLTELVAHATVTLEPRVREKTGIATVASCGTSRRTAPRTSERSSSGKGSPLPGMTAGTATALRPPRHRLCPGRRQLTELCRTSAANNHSPAPATGHSPAPANNHSPAPDNQPLPRPRQPLPLLLRRRRPPSTTRTATQLKEPAGAAHLCGEPGYRPALDRDNDGIALRVAPHRT